MNRKPGGNTPTTVDGLPPRSSVPSESRALIWVRQNVWLTMTTDGPPTAFSSAVNSRPINGFTPRMPKKPRDTPIDGTRTGSSPTVTVCGDGGIAEATPKKVRACERQSAKLGYDA